MLSVKDLHVSYGYINALNGINLEVGEKQIITLIGANGAGKTTTLMAISGMVNKLDGTVTFEGKDISDLTGHEIARMGISHVPEGRHVFPKLSVEENLIMGSISDKKVKKAEMLQRMENMFDLFPRLRERRDQAAGTLSGGEQQMLAIARGLMSNPKLLMLDEPSLGLAPIVVEEIFDLIVRVKEMGTTILLIEQNASMALSIADYAYVLELGTITMEGTGKDLINDENVKKAYLGM